MGDPAPFDPPLYDPEDKPNPDAPRPAIERVDWLVGSGDGLIAERDRVDRGPAVPLEAPRLAPRSDPEAGRDRPVSHPALPFRTPALSRPAAMPPPAAPSPSMPSWNAGASSVPMMRRSAGPTASSGGPMPELSRDFPMDDAEERARVSAQRAEQQAHEAALMARPHEVVQPREFDLPTVPLPWWSQLPNVMKADKRLQLAVLLLLLGMALATFWPRAEKTISVAHLKEHAERYGDQQVRVAGRVAEVFPIGGSVAYTLVQGRDTIVVFSRSRIPKPREHVIVIGTLSTGYLGGETRTAIFEATH